MSRKRIELRLYLKLLLFAALLGLMSAMITFAIQELVQVGQVLIWKRAAHAAGLSAPVFTLSICSHLKTTSKATASGKAGRF